MAQGRNQLAVIGTDFQALQALPAEQAIDAYAANIAQVLPPNITIDQFKRVVVTAIIQNPDLAVADRRSLLMSCVKCANDGLLPDGRQAALVIYRTKVPGTQNQYYNGVQYMPMVYGIRQRMRNTGEVASADAHAVYCNDHFKYALGDQPFIDHQPAGLDQEPGDVIGAYAIIKLSNGEVIRDVLRKSDIERARKASKTPEGPMWKDHYGEAARKTALRRCSKAAPQSAVVLLNRMLDRDDEIDLPEPGEIAPAPPRPMRQQFEVVDGGASGAGEPIVAEDAPVFCLIDLDGVESEFTDVAELQKAMLEHIAEAERRGKPSLDGLMESNGDLFQYLQDQGKGDAERAIILAANASLERIQNPAYGRTGSPVAAQSAGQATSPPAGEQVTQRPSDASGAAPPLPGASPVERNAFFLGDNLALTPRQRNGKPDWITWRDAQFLPKVRLTAVNADMAKLLGDNEQHLTAFAAAVGQPARAALQKEIDAQWAKIPAES